MAKLLKDRSQDKRRRIEAAALALFTTQGFHGTNNREIAKRAGVSTAAIYTHYPSKEALFIGLVEQHRALVAKWLRKTIAGLKDPLAIPDLTAFASAIRAKMRKDPEYFLLIFIDVVEFKNQHFRASFHDVPESPRARPGSRQCEQGARLVRAGPGVRPGRGLHVFCTLRADRTAHGRTPPSRRLQRAGDQASGRAAVWGAVADAAQDRARQRSSQAVEQFRAAETARGGDADPDAFNENLSFNNFIGAFQSLVGSVDQPSTAQMQTFTDFQLQVVPPPNPVRSLDNSLTASQQRGHDFYFGPHPSDGFNVPGTGLVLGTTTFTCNGCHALDPSQGKFGTSQNDSFEGIEQIFKIPHLRNLYTKVGMFGMAKVPFFDSPDTGFTGPQIRGFGFTNEGSPDTIFTFFNAEVFRSTLTAGSPLANGDQTRRDVEQFMLAFDSDLAPIVGQQVTLTNQNAGAVSPRIALLERRAGTAFTSKILGGTVTECDLVASVVQAGTVKGFLYHPSSAAFVPGDASTPLSDSALRALAAVAGQEVTYSCVPPGSGARIAYSK